MKKRSAIPCNFHALFVYHSCYTIHSNTILARQVKKRKNASFCPRSFPQGLHKKARQHISEVKASKGGILKFFGRVNLLKKGLCEKGHFLTQKIMYSVGRWTDNGVEREKRRMARQKRRNQGGWGDTPTVNLILPTQATVNITNKVGTCFETAPSYRKKSLDREFPSSFAILSVDSRLHPNNWQPVESHEAPTKMVGR